MVISLLNLLQQTVIYVSILKIHFMIIISNFINRGSLL